MEENIKNPLMEALELLLSDFEYRVPVWGVTVFTVDGYILAHRLFYTPKSEAIESVISPMSASLITIAEDLIRFVGHENIFRQMIIDADDAMHTHQCSIFLKHLAENILLACIFPVTVQLGLLLFEIDHLSDQVRDLLTNWPGLLHNDSVT
jgi:predicted regulator of Ras-like GTPase activity (Roadblock/LC7/MglB family)